MNISQLFLLPFTSILLLTVACTNDESTNKTTQQQESATKTFTTFTTEDGKSRTTADYDGTGISFYWTKDDRIWVNKIPTLCYLLI